MNKLFRCTLTNGWEQEFVRAADADAAALIYRDVLEDRGATMPARYPHCLIYEMTEPEGGGDGLVYEADQTPKRFDLRALETTPAG